MSWWYQGGEVALLLPAAQVPLPEPHFEELMEEEVSLIPSGPGPAFR